MAGVTPIGIGRAIETIANKAGKGTEGDKFNDVFRNKDTVITTFASFFEPKMIQFTANMVRAAENQSNGQGHRPD